MFRTDRAIDFSQQTLRDKGKNKNVKKNEKDIKLAEYFPIS